MIKAIETVYKGYRFRSRLEARWAVFFDALDIEWLYEPEGFENENGYRYLPDFKIKLGNVTYWVEVKGDKDWLFKEKHTVQAIHDFGGILPNFCDNGYKDHIPNGLILLGDIPAPVHGVMFVPVVNHRKGANLYWRALRGNEQLSKLDQIFYFEFNCRDEYESIGFFEQKDCDFQPKIVKTRYANLEMAKALEAARSARFEHGERGIAWQT
jgi:hypothetical protein